MASRFYSTEDVVRAVAMRPDGVDEDILCRSIAQGHHHGGLYDAANRAVRQAVAEGAVRERGDFRLFSIPRV